MSVKGVSEREGLKRGKGNVLDSRLWEGPLREGRGYAGFLNVASWEVLALDLETENKEGGVAEGSEGSVCLKSVMRWCRESSGRA